jgi:hypothetical protein
MIIVAWLLLLPRCLIAVAAAGVKGVPGFWATILGRAEMVLNEKDAEALTYLTGETGAVLLFGGRGVWGGD